MVRMITVSSIQPLFNTAPVPMMPVRIAEKHRAPPSHLLDFAASAFANDESTVPVYLAASPQNTPARMITHAQQDELPGSASELSGSASDSSYELAGEGRRSRSFTWQAVESLHLQGPAQTHQIPSEKVLYLLERMYQNTRVATSPKRKSKQLLYLLERMYQNTRVATSPKRKSKQERFM